MKPAGICFAGRIGSGKTTIARALAGALRWKYVSFGDYVRREAQSRGLDSDSRAVLQSIGNDLISAGWIDFVRAVVAQAGWQLGEGLIVDGIRHMQGLSTLRSLLHPMPVFLVFIQTDEVTLRSRRHERRSGAKEIDENGTERHSTESQVDKYLRSAANLVIDGGSSVEASVGVIVSWLSGQ